MLFEYKTAVRAVRNQLRSQQHSKQQKNEILRCLFRHFVGRCCLLRSKFDQFSFNNRINLKSELSFRFRQKPGTTVVTKTVTTTTTSSADGVSGDYALIKSTWELARKNGNIAPKFLFR